MDGEGGVLWTKWEPLLKFRLKTLELADGAAKAVRVRPEAKSGTRGGASINSLHQALELQKPAP